MTFKKHTKACWNIELNVHCPYCGEYFCILPQWIEQGCNEICKEFQQMKLNTKFGNEDLIAGCENCNKDFIISETEM